MNWVGLLASMNRGTASTCRIAIPAAVLLGPDYVPGSHTRHVAARTLEFVTPRDIFDLIKFWVIELIAATLILGQRLVSIAETSAQLRAGGNAIVNVQTRQRRRQAPLTTSPIDAIGVAVRHASALALVMALTQMPVSSPAPHQPEVRHAVARPG